MSAGGKIPKGLRRLLSALTEEDKIRKFKAGHSRDPRDEEELNEFVLHLARELYNADYDEWPEDDLEVD